MNADELVFQYHRKPETKTSYNRKPEPGLIPERIGFSIDGFTPIKRTGAAFIHSKMGQVKADFKKTDASPYKPSNALKPFVHFTLFWFDEKQDFSFANVAYLGENGKVIATNDLVIARFKDQDRQILEISLFPRQYNHRIEIVGQMRTKESNTYRSPSF